MFQIWHKAAQHNVVLCHKHAKKPGYVVWLNESQINVYVRWLQLFCLAQMTLGLQV